MERDEIVQGQVARQIADHRPFFITLHHLPGQNVDTIVFYTWARGTVQMTMPGRPHLLARVLQEVGYTHNQVTNSIGTCHVLSRNSFPVEGEKE